MFMLINSSFNPLILIGWDSFSLLAVVGINNSDNWTLKVTGLIIQISAKQRKCNTISADFNGVHRFFVFKEFESYFFENVG